MLSKVHILMITLLVVPDLYIYLMYVRHWTTNKWKRAAYFIPALFLIVYYLIVHFNDDMHMKHQVMVGTLMVVFLTLTAPKMLFTIFDSIGYGISRLRGEENCSGTIRRYIRLLSMTIAISSTMVILYGYFWGRNQYVVNEQTIYFKNLPEAFDGYRLLHFSDLHLGTFGDGHQSDVSTIVNLLNKQKCDAILFTGDIVNYESLELEGYKEVLSRLKAKDGVFSVMGNHDYNIYLPYATKEEKDADTERIKAAERTYGWKLLLNENSIIRRGNDSIAIAGSENDGLPPWPSLGDIPKATKGLTGIERSKSTDFPADSIPDHTFTVMLTHDPTHWRRNILPETYIDLTLAGHTHAGQFKLLGWSPVQLRYTEWSGVYTEGSQVINVTDGIGQIMLPLRFGAWPEADIITLKRLRQ